MYIVFYGIYMYSMYMYRVIDYVQVVYECHYNVHVSCFCYKK
jgi:hypothetical protein